MEVCIGLLLPARTPHVARAEGKPASRVPRGPVQRIAVEDKDIAGLHVRVEVHFSAELLAEAWCKLLVHACMGVGLEVLDAPARVRCAGRLDVCSDPPAPLDKLQGLGRVCERQPDAHHVVAAALPVERQPVIRVPERRPSLHPVGVAPDGCLLQLEGIGGVEDAHGGGGELREQLLSHERTDSTIEGPGLVQGLAVGLDR
mmetsp:Transcript_94031/g.303751  ORF Transcript_94031/g.303751 Transcript_94031/m.303751 type:complete len:201 (-) Transcript_94031:21-623(-)